MLIKIKKSKNHIVSKTILKSLLIGLKELRLWKLDIALSLFCITIDFLFGLQYS